MKNSMCNNPKNNTNEDSHIDLQIPLRGVLKNHDDNIVDHKSNKRRLIKVCIILLTIVIIIPIVVCLLIL